MVSRKPRAGDAADGDWVLAAGCWRLLTKKDEELGRVVRALAAAAGACEGARYGVLGVPTPPRGSWHDSSARAQKKHACGPQLRRADCSGEVRCPHAALVRPVSLRRTPIPAQCVSTLGRLASTPSTQRPSPRRPRVRRDACRFALCAVLRTRSARPATTTAPTSRHGRGARTAHLRVSCPARRPGARRL